MRVCSVQPALVQTGFQGHSHIGESRKCWSLSLNLCWSFDPSCCFCQPAVAFVVCVCVQEKQKDYEKMLAVERKKRLLERKEKRKEERRTKWVQEKEEAAQKACDEQLKKGE